jgi:hypothetical protein
MPSRTVARGLYVSDILGPGTTFTRRVDDHLFTQAQFGWTPPVGGETPLPVGLRPRRVVGVDASGMRHTAVVADISAALWTRATATWDILDDTGTLQSVTVTGLVGEQFTA